MFASGNEVPVKFICEKLGCSTREINNSINELKERYGDEGGLRVLTFNGKIQLASNPLYRQQIADVLIPIKEKEFTKTILECAALIAYKQPITKPELEEIRQVSCDYAIKTLLDLEMIVPCGRKDAVGKPILYSTTDNFLKRFKLNSIDELPDYDDLMAQIAELNNTFLTDDEDANYLYKKDVYVDSTQNEVVEEVAVAEDMPKTTDDGYELPDFLKPDEEEEMIEIK